MHHPESGPHMRLGARSKVGRAACHLLRRVSGHLQDEIRACLVGTKGN